MLAPRNFARHAAPHRAHDRHAEGHDADARWRALAVAILAAQAGGSSGGQARRRPSASAQALAIQQQLNFTRANEYEADRIGFQRIGRRRLRSQRHGDVHGAAADASAILAIGNAPSYLRDAPGHLRAHRRGAGARAGPAVPAGARFARLPDGARAVASYEGDAARGGRVLRPRARRAQVQQR